MNDRGLLAMLDPEYRAWWEAQRSEEDKRRQYAASRLSALYLCTDASACSWLDRWEQEDRPPEYTLH
jgi:hypothetical protein